MLIDVLLEHLGAETLILTESADRFALAHMAGVTKADVRASERIDFRAAR